MKEKIHSPHSGRKFMFRKSGRSAPEKTLAERQPAIGIRELSLHFPRMAFGREFIDKAISRLENSLKFGVILIRIDGFSEKEKESGKESAVKLLTDTARILDRLCTPAQGIWGLIERDLFGCFFPEGNEFQGREYAEKIQAEMGQSRSESLSMGISAYPLIRFTRMDTIRNARKALEHGIFLGTGRITVFDALSLNISGDRLYRLGHIKEAIEEFKSALLLNPSDANVHNSLGVCYGVLGAANSALEEFRTAARISPQEAMPVYNAGLLLLQMKEKEQALDCFSRALEIAPDVFETVFQIARIFLEMGETEKSRNLFRKALELRPESAKAFRWLGQCCSILHRTDESIAAYRNAIRLNPDDAEALSSLGLLYDLRGENPDIALSFCRHSVEIAPDRGLFRQRLGRIYHKRNLLDQALAEFEEADRLGCDSGEFIREIRAIIKQG